MQQPGICVANEAGFQNIITEARVMKCPSVCQCVCPTFRSRASVGASDAAGIIRLPMKYLSHIQFRFIMLFCVPGFMLIHGFAKG